MKKLLIIIGCFLLLSGCGDQTSSPAIHQNESVKKPGIPKGSVQEVQASPSLPDEIQDPKNLTEDPLAMDDLIKRINSDLTGQDIAKVEIEQGWYYAEEGDRKIGTPSSWNWVQHEGGSYWISPDTSKKFTDTAADQLCRQTGGFYVISCIESELPHCEYIPESTCNCNAGSRWLLQQGCLLIDEKEEWVEINSEELTQGWYAGSRSEKKYNTPISWVWVGDAEGGRWKNEGGL